MCEDRSVLTCEENGVWKPNKPCPNACSNGACVGECVPGSYQCLDSAVQSCNSGGLWETVATCPDACFQGQCVESCVPGQQRCKDLVLQTCSASGLWQDSRTCLYLCSAGACTGECTPGSRRCRQSFTQTCSNDAVWVDQQACSGDTPICAGGQCVATCLSAGQDCTNPQAVCCPGSECVSGAAGATFVCKAVPACALLGTACAANTNCCAGLDCADGECVARTETCLDAPGDGVCGGASSVSCCPGSVCEAAFPTNELGCVIPSTMKPQDSSCPRDRPGQHEPCSRARFGLECRYEDWAKEPGIYYTCTCSYHGWSCVKGYYS
jgi:hypothetical protein